MSLMILAGHPQYVYYTGLITLIYTALLCISTPHRARLATGYLIIIVCSTFWVSSIVLARKVLNVDI